MPQRTDLYTVLNSYARKNNSPKIDMETFIAFLEKYSKRICEEKPEWTKWTEETGTRVWMDINRLVEDGKANIHNDETGSWVYLSHYFVEQIKDAYRNPDKESDIPFPDEISLNIEIPPEQIKSMDASAALPHFLEQPQKEWLPMIKLVFPNDRGIALLAAPMIPNTLLEFSVLKIRGYLNRRGNKDFIQRKLSPRLTSKENYLQETIDKIMLRPADCLNDIKAGREISYSFWAHFCNLVKNDLNQKKELLSEELGALQSIYIIEVCSSFFKNKAVKTRETELAFKNFELEMEKPPYYFSRETIAKFKDNKGVPLLGVYTQDGLDAYIKKRVSDPVTPKELPDLLFFYTEDKQAWLIKKTKLLPLCARLLTEARPVIIKTISRRWKKMFKEFIRENAMDDDREFERLVSSYVEENAPMLKALLKDKRLYLIHEEMQTGGKEIHESSRFFQKNELLPLHILLLIKRKQLLSDIKLLMPFWYTMPVISNIVAFFTNLGKKKKKLSLEEKSTGKKETEDPLKELRKNAAESIVKLIPPGKNIDSCLDDLASRWGLLINKQAKANLVEDVNSLIRDKLRQLLRIHKHRAVSTNTLDNLTNTIMDTKGLLKISEQNNLFQYIKLYIAKLLINRTIM
ncbi:MAG: hypothetical protein FWG07_09445 [Treponema sp.]|nr:hypothetical protein [Treponema sp.]